MASVVLCTGGFDHKIRFWDATSGSMSRMITFHEQAQINCLTISPDKNLVAAGGNPMIHLYDINSSDEKPILVYDGHTNNVMTVGFQKNMKWLYSCSEDGSIRVWDPRTSASSRSYDCGCAVNTVALNPNQVELISGDQNGCIKVWDLMNDGDMPREQHIPAVDVPIRSISIAVDASIVTVGTHKGKVFIYTITAAKNLQLVKEFQAHNDYLLKCIISPDVNTIATTSADKTIKLWNTTTWELGKTLTQHQRWVWDAVFSADSLYLVSVSSDHSGKLWDLSTGEVIRTYQTHGLAVTCVALNDTS